MHMITRRDVMADFGESCIDEDVAAADKHFTAPGFLLPRRQGHGVALQRSGATLPGQDESPIQFAKVRSPTGWNAGARVRSGLRVKSFVDPFRCVDINVLADAGNR